MFFLCLAMILSILGLHIVSWLCTLLVLKERAPLAFLSTCVWTASMLPLRSLALTNKLVVFCDPNRVWCLCTFCLPTRWRRCNVLITFTSSALCVLRRRTWLQNNQLLVWTALWAICTSIAPDKLALVVALLVQTFSKSSLASNPDCGKPYIPQFTTMHTDSSFVALAFKLYSLVILSRMSLNLVHMYSGRANGVMR